MTKKKNTKQEEEIESEVQSVVAEPQSEPTTEEKTESEAAESDDDPTSVKLTILVFCTDKENDAPFLRLALRSLENLRGINALVKVTGRNKPIWFPHEDFISVAEVNDTHIDIIRKALALIEDKRVILMTDRMMMARPVTLADIALLKAIPDSTNATCELLKKTYSAPNPYNYDTGMPLYAFTQELLETMNLAEFQDVKEYDIATLYNNAVFPDIKPLFVYWKTDSWVLPIVKASPEKAVVMEYVKRKRFIHCISGTPRVIEVIESLFPNPSQFELDKVEETLA